MIRKHFFFFFSATSLFAAPVNDTLSTLHHTHGRDTLLERGYRNRKICKIAAGARMCTSELYILNDCKYNCPKPFRHCCNVSTATFQTASFPLQLFNYEFSTNAEPSMAITAPLESPPWPLPPCFSPHLHPWRTPGCRDATHWN